MSDPRTKAERSKAKDIRQGGVDQKERTRNVSKKDKPVVLEYRYTKTFSKMFGDLFRQEEKTRWRRYKSYRSLEEAKKAMSNLLRKHPTLYAFRLPEDK